MTKHCTKPLPPSNNWVVYIILCTDDSLYTGVSNNFARRWRQHCGEIKNGAKFFRGRKPQRLYFIEDNHNRSSALQREYQIKQLTRAQKNSLIQDAPAIESQYAVFTNNTAQV